MNYSRDALMLGGIFDCWQKPRQWRRDDLSTFATMSHTDENAFTTFQNPCLNTLSGYLPISSFERITGKENPVYPKAPIGNIAADLFIHETEAGISGPSQDKPFEQWDVMAPADLIAA